MYTTGFGTLKDKDIYIMKKTLSGIFILIFLCTHPVLSTPIGVVYIEKYNGLLGNQLFQFCLGKVLADELNFSLKCPPIFGFPETHLHNNVKLPAHLRTERLTGHVINFKAICQNKDPRIIKLEGIFARYEYFKNHKQKIRTWLRFKEPIDPHPNPNDIVLHVRIQPGTGVELPFDYYHKVLSIAQYDRVYICTNHPTHPFLKNFTKYNPIIKKATPLNSLLNEYGKQYDKMIPYVLDDFKFITSFNKIVAAQSTFSWWAALISDATEIYAPLPRHGIMSKERPDVQLTGIEEPRYIYIKC